MKGYNKLWESSDGEITCLVQNYDKNYEGVVDADEVLFIRDEFIFAVKNNSPESVVYLVFRYEGKSLNCACSNFFENTAYMTVGEILKSWDFLRRQEGLLNSTSVAVDITWGQNTETLIMLYCNADPPSAFELPDRFITNDRNDYISVRSREDMSIKIDGIPSSMARHAPYKLYPVKAIETDENICVRVEDKNCVNIEWSDCFLGMNKIYGFEAKSDSYESERLTVLNAGYKYNKTENHSRTITLCQYMSYRDWRYCRGLALADDVKCLGDYWTVESMDGFDSMNVNGKQYINITLKSL